MNSFKDIGSVVVVLLLSGMPGCAAPPSSDAGVQVKSRPQPAADVDPTRAFTALSAIEPAVMAPTEGTAVNPLSDRAAQALAAAKDLINRQRFTEAALELERALRTDPRHPDLHVTLAVLHWRAGNLERAVSHVQRTLESEPDNAVAHYILGRSAASRKDRPAAIQAFRTALLCKNVGVDPETEALVHFYLAEELEQGQYLEAALEQYVLFDGVISQLAGSPKNADLISVLGARHGSAADERSRILEKLGRSSEALDVLEKSAGVAPGSVPDPKRMIRYAQLNLQAGRFDEARRVILPLALEDDEAFALLLEIHERSGRPQAVLDDLRTQAADRPQEVRATLKLSELHNRFGQKAESRLVLSRYLEAHPDAQAVRDRLLDRITEDEAWSEFLTVCLAGVSTQPSQFEKYESRMQALARSPGAVEALLSAPNPQGNPVADCLLGILAAAAGRNQEAESLLTRSLASDPGWVPARVALGNLLFRTFRYEQALALVAAPGDSAAPDARLELLLGRIHERLDDLEKASKHFRAATQLNSGDSQALYELALLHRRVDDRLTSQRELRLVLERNPGHDEAREALVLSFVQEGKLDAAVEQIEELKKRSNSPHAKARAQAFIELLRGRDVEEYRKTLRAALDTDGPNAATWQALGDSYTEFEQSAAREAYLNVLALDPDHEAAALGVIFAEQRLLNYESAAQRLSLLLPRRPNRHAWRVGSGGTSWHIGLIETYLVLLNPSSALALAQEQERRQDLDPQTRARYRFAILEALRQGNDQEAILNRLKEWSAPGAPEAEGWTTRLASEYVRREDYTTAIPLLEATFQAKPGDRAALGELVDALTSAKKFDSASQRMLDWLAEDSENDDALAALAIVLGRQERFADSQELVRNKLLRTQDRERFQDLHLLLLSRAKRHKDAVSALESFIGGVTTAIRGLQEPRGRRGAAPLSQGPMERLPNEPFTFPQLQQRLEMLQAEMARQMIEAKDYREAETRLRDWLEYVRNPRTRFQFLITLAHCQTQQGDDGRAGETMQLAWTLEPDHVTLNNDVAYGWIDRGVRLDEAERMIRFALSRAPRQVSFLDTYGWLCYKRGDFTEARKWLERAAALESPKDPVVLEHLGDACWQAGDRTAAIGHWEQARTLIEKRPSDQLNADERRVRTTIEQKINVGRSGANPGVAALEIKEKPQSE